ncbi:MAG: NADH-quinone oxidoreductase subunit L [Candidatus Omnitrophica bacterium]|nr:NADH-quinone oxidoreductase subunit L [Candidatus Omnitrophota bacterium]
MVDPRLLPWIVLFAPFLASVLICLFSMKSPRLASGLAVAGILVSLAGSAALFLHHSAHGGLPAERSFPWIEIAGLSVDFGFLIDRLSLLMLLVVTGVGSCIFFYSVGYMKGDSSFPRYFASLSFFAFSMLGIVLANNFVMLFVFWELVAVSSYLLIGFWFEKPSAADAGNKAFIVNRVADFGFVLGIFYVWTLSGADGGARSFGFTHLESILPEFLAKGILAPTALVIASLLVFCGVIGKSAQFPLYIWLPDAMEGPTPVSALIHAATMVAAGVYLMSRCFFLVSGVPQALGWIAATGALTALLAAILAVAQNDIKKILAYSTISQLGYMVLALGLGSSTVAMYHLTTHAFFKALLFLGAGAVIHRLGTQDIWEMGALLKRMPVTAVTFLVGTLALCGLPPFSGFFSKDEILTLAHEHNRTLYVTALFTAFLTAFYMGRASWIAVLGPERKIKHAHGPSHGHGDRPRGEAPLVMLAPLVLLACLAAAGGFIGIPEFILGGHGHAAPLNLPVAVTSTVAALLGIAAATALFGKKGLSADPLARAPGKAYAFIVNKYYLDDLFSAIAGFFQNALAKILFWFDWNILIQKGVNGAAGATSRAASLMRRAQTGRVQDYATTFGFGFVVLAYFMLSKG